MRGSERNEGESTTRRVENARCFRWDFLCVLYAPGGTKQGNREKSGETYRLGAFTIICALALLLSQVGLQLQLLLIKNKANLSFTI